MSAEPKKLSPRISDKKRGIAAFPDEASGCRISLKDGVALVVGVKPELATLDIPQTFGNSPVMVLSEEALRYQFDLKAVTLPQGLQIIGKEAFYSCSSLKSLQIPDTVHHIGTYAFAFCREMRWLNIPAGLTSIGMNPFIHCGKLEIFVPEGHPVIAMADGVIFSKRERRLIHSFKPLLIDGEYVVPDGTVSMDDFSLCTKNGLRHIVLPDTLKKLGYACFMRNPKLEAVAIPDGVTEIPMDCFSCCGALKYVRLPKRLQSIETTAFDRCNALERIRIPGSVTSIAPDAFKSCSPNLVLEGRKSSYADHYAKNHGLRFESDP